MSYFQPVIKSSRILLCALTLALSAGSLVPMGKASMLINGSFEQGPSIPSGFSFRTLTGGSTAVPGWIVTGSTIDYIGPGWDTSGGIRAIDLDGSSSIGGIQQTFGTTAGQHYFVQFDLAGNADAGPTIKNVRVAVDTFLQDYAFDITGQNRGALDWQTIAFSFVASGPFATLSFTSLSSAGNSWGALIDNVSVNQQFSAVPEPSTLLLLATGLGLWGVTRRRRHRGA